MTNSENYTRNLIIFLVVGTMKIHIELVKIKQTDESANRNVDQNKHTKALVKFMRQIYYAN